METIDTTQYNAILVSEEIGMSCGLSGLFYYRPSNPKCK